MSQRREGEETSSPVRKPESARDFRSVIYDHPLVILAGCVFAALGMIFAAERWAAEQIDEKVAATLNRKMWEFQAETERRVNSRADYEMIYSIDEDGDPAGSVDKIVAAVEAGRTIYVRYTRDRNMLYRACNDFAIDIVDGSRSVSCFVLRVPDTNPTETGRTWADQNVFEDSWITTNRSIEWRKYKLEDGRLILDRRSFPGRSSAVFWYATPLPVGASAGG